MDKTDVNPESTSTILENAAIKSEDFCVVEDNDADPHDVFIVRQNRDVRIVHERVRECTKEGDSQNRFAGDQAKVTDIIVHYERSNVKPWGILNRRDVMPTFLINEMAQYNKIIPQCKVIHESGPCHNKTFVVALTLGDEEYIGLGPSIKRAKHFAACIALEKTLLKPPPSECEEKPCHLKKAVEELDETSKDGEKPMICQITEALELSAEDRGFCRKGSTPGKAKRNTEKSTMNTLSRFSDKKKALNEERDVVNGKNYTSVAKSHLKHPVTYLYEIAHKLSLPIRFEVSKESGPPHLPVFLTRCFVLDVITAGRGESKKVSKTRAAERMLEELRNILPSHYSFKDCYERTE